MALVNILTLRPFSEKKMLLQHLSYSPYIRAICSLYFQKMCEVASGSYAKGNFMYFFYNNQPD